MEVETIKQMRVDINSALKGVAKQYNADITTANARYDSNNMTFQLKVLIKDETGQVRTPEMADFERFATIYGITKQLGDKVIANGMALTLATRKVFTIAGLKTNSPKYPVLATSNGRTYKFTVDNINKMKCIK